MNTANPLLVPSTLPYMLPPFAEIRPAHVWPAFTAALARQEAEIQAITTTADAPNWENTVEALERSGQDLARVLGYFANLSGTDSTPELEEIGAKLWPRLAAHQDAIHQNAELYARLQAVTAPADEESQRLHAHLLRQFQRAGAQLSTNDKAELTRLNQELSALAEEFSRNLLASTRAHAVTFDNAADLAGLPAGLIPDDLTLHLELPTVQSAQSRLQQPESRRQLYAASRERGRDHGQDHSQDHNVAVLVKMVQLRAQRAQLLGFDCHADYVIAAETAGSTAAVRELLEGLSPAAATNATREQQLLEQEAQAQGQDFQAADWPYWESQVRARDFALDQEELRKYFPLDRVLTHGVFAAAHRLYGITVIPRDDLSGYAPGVRVWEVLDGAVPDGEDPSAAGTGIGLFITDYFGRTSKRGGAWMSDFVNQSHLLGTQPVIVNVMGITAPTDGSQPLLSLDELRTIFHEFGHALHGLLSDVRYPTFAGTNVPRDWVEFPSQINENWALDPLLVKEYAQHVETGETIPDELLAACQASSTFGQGFATYEYLAAAVIDLAWHSLTAAEAAALDVSAAVDAFERDALTRAGLDNELISPRYHSTYFSHIFAGGYAAAYYSYLWAEALDADGFAWFQEVGAAGADATPATTRRAGQRFRDLILSRGASRDFNTAYRELRGRDKDLTPLLARRGLNESA